MPEILRTILKNYVIIKVNSITKSYVIFKREEFMNIIFFFC